MLVYNYDSCGLLQTVYLQPYPLTVLKWQRSGGRGLKELIYTLHHLHHIPQVAIHRVPGKKPTI